MAWWLAALLLLFAGCPLPEDSFVLSGVVLDEVGGPRAGVEVRLLRDQVPSETRCSALEPLETTRTDEEGRYGFTLIRQQLTRGVSARRFFRVEVDHGERVASQSFWFPDADLDLGPLSLSIPEEAWQHVESRLDERIAWRTDSSGAPRAFDRPSELRWVASHRTWRTVPVDSLGRWDVVPVEWRVESPWRPNPQPLVDPPSGRGGECPFLGVTPCPLTDGRYVPFTLPPGTRTLVFNFKQEVQVVPLAFHGLVLGGRAAKVRLEFNFGQDFENWNKFATVPFNGQWQDVSVERCNEPGAFFSLGTNSFIKPVLLRIAFQDEAGDLVPIVSLAEISTR